MHDEVKEEYLDDVILDFEDASAFLDYVVNTPPIWESDLASSSQTTETRSFTQTQSFEEAVELARWGWKEGLDKLGEKIDILKKKTGNKPVPDRLLDRAGRRPLVDRAAGGDPLSMERKHPEDDKFQPSLKIVIRLGYPGDVDTDTIMAWGAALTRTIEAIENEGCTVEVLLSNESHGSSFEDYFDKDYNWIKKTTRQRVGTKFTLKEAGRPLNLSNFVFWTAHPSANRRLKFRFLETLDIEERFSRSYGHSSFFRDHGPNAILLSLDEASKDPEKNLKYLQEIMGAELERQEAVAAGDEEAVKEAEKKKRKAEENTPAEEDPIKKLFSRPYPTNPKKKKHFEKSGGAGGKGQGGESGSSKGTGKKDKKSAKDAWDKEKEDSNWWQKLLALLSKLGRLPGIKDLGNLIKDIWRGARKPTVDESDPNTWFNPRSTEPLTPQAKPPSAAPAGGT